jgi:hypothetical protein
MVLQNNRLAGSKMRSDPFAFFSIQNNTPKLWIYGMIVVEPEAVLSDHVQLPPKDTECFSIDAVRVAC